jgi:DNA adenine methylase
MFPYIGGKAHHVKWMSELFPEDFSRFVEVFGGAGWVSVKSKKISNVDEHIYNDFNPLIANVYYCFSKHPKEVLSLMESTEKSVESRYKEYQKELFSDLDWDTITLGDVGLAVKYLYLQTQVFAGTPLSTNNVPYFTEVKTKGKYPSKYDTLIKKLRDDKIVNRLSNIGIVEKMDCVELIKKYDSKDTFFYLDPPYHSKEFYYSQDFPKEKHKELADTLNNIEGKFALSYYDFEDLRQFYPEDKFSWYRKNVYRSAATRSSTDEDYSEKSRAEELLIMNYQESNGSSLEKWLEN